MITKANRFHGYSSIGHVHRKGRVIRGKYAALKYVPGTQHQSYRAAVVVSKKVSKSAVVRNHIRRRVYEIIRLEQPNIKANYDMVLTVFHERAGVDAYEELRQSLRIQFRQAGII